MDCIFDVSQFSFVKSFFCIQCLGYLDDSSVQFILSYVHRSDEPVSDPCIFEFHEDVRNRDGRVVNEVFFLHSSVTHHFCVRGVSWSEVATVPKRKSHRGLDLDLSLNSEVNIRKG